MSELIGRRFTVTVKHPAPGMDDMDWTEPFLERGTTMAISGPMSTDRPVPVTKAWVADEVLHMQGEVEWGPNT